MANILIRIPTKDYAAWRPVFDTFALMRKSTGSQGGDLYRNAENPDEVFILWDWDNLDNGRKFFQSQELREGMQRAGVTGRPDVYYLEEIESVAV